MTLRRFLPVVAYDPDTETLTDSALGHVYAIDDTELTTPLAVYDAAGNPIDGNTLQVSNGLLQEFQVDDHDVVRFVAGDAKVPVWSPQTLMVSAVNAAEDAASAADAAASAALNAVQGSMEAINDAATEAVNSYMTAEGFSPLRVVQTIDDIVIGSRPGTAYLVIDAPTPVVAPEIIGFEMVSSSSGSTLVASVPAGVEEGDLLVCFLTCQHSGGVSGSEWSSDDLDGWILANTGDVNLRCTAIGYRQVVGSVPSTLEFTFGVTDQRRLALVVAVRGAKSDVTPWVIGSPQGLNGVGTGDTVVPAVISTTSKALHLVFGWSNGNTTLSQDPSAPTVPETLSVVGGKAEPTTPSGGFTTGWVWARELETGGSTGTVTLDWPLVSQRAGVTLVILGEESA